MWDDVKISPNSGLCLSGLSKLHVIKCDMDVIDNAASHKNNVVRYGTN